ncbi:caspase-1-like [Anopheles darlingi]|nr:caspase-1-like [Anopheles darlingi]
MANKRKYGETVLVQSGSTQMECDAAGQHAEDDPDEEYNMNHEKRGRAIIISHEKFTALDPRKGTNKDRDDVCKVLEKLGFEVRHLNDPEKSTINEKLEQIAKEDHTNSDCLVVIVMTHGAPGVLYAADGAYNVDELWNKFTGDSCKTLHGKPKLFFIQACRGVKLDSGVQYVEDTVDAIEMQPTSYFTVPTEPDFLVMFSTYDGHYSFRNPSNGSWFIQSLCTVLESYGHKKELLRILTAVSENVAYNYISNVPDKDKFDKKKQIPTIISTLTKAVYFRSK